MNGLGDSEKYNAVLQGVSSIVMGKKKVGGAAMGSFEEVFQLLDEMHANRIKCTIRTASAVVDAATSTTNIGVITKGMHPPRGHVQKRTCGCHCASLTSLLKIGIAGFTSVPKVDLSSTQHAVGVASLQKH